MTNPQDIPADELEDLQGLLRLKNYEQPAEGYFEDFLDEFHRRQREEARNEGAASVWSRFSEWFADLGAAKWAVGAGVAYAVLAVAFFATTGGSKSSNLAKETEDFLPEGSKLQHVELGAKKPNDPTKDRSEEVLEILPSEF